jgi:cytochrome b561
MPPAQHAVATTVHALLYVALIAQPILGFLATNAFGFPLQWFWLVEIPSPVGHDEAIAPYFMGAHVIVGYSIVVLFLLHMAGVLFHHVVKRDETLERML